MKNNLWRITILTLASLVFTFTASAQYTETVLYDFGTTVNDGHAPSSGLTFDEHGNLYTTTTYGGTYNLGTIVKLSPNSDGSWSESVIYSFAGATDGAYPNGLAIDSLGNIFGTTNVGGETGGICGKLGCGTIFELSSIAGGGWSEQVLYRFNGGPGGYNPSGQTVLDSAGNLFGVNRSGGAHTDGTVFELSPSTSGWTFNLVYYFQLFISGGDPTGALTIDGSGNLYGATVVGGNGGAGSVFRLSPASDGSWTFTKLYQFYGPGGATPGFGLALDAAGNVYGSTVQGGKSTSACVGGGCGVIYKMTPTTTGLWKETLLHQFTGGEDGSAPYGGVAVDSAGNVYGTASYGGQHASDCYPYGCGTAFKLTPVSGGWLFSRLTSFVDSSGVNPYTPIVLDSAGNVFGTTYAGGATLANCNSGIGCGVIFELSPPAASAE